MALHALAVTLFLFARTTPHAPNAVSYQVNLIAAPAGPRATGVVQPPRAAPPVATKAPAAPVRNERPIPAPQQKQAKAAPHVAQATPNQPVTRAPVTAAPTAGGGAQGGQGADVANIRTEGITFPYGGYLENIVRQIALRFQPPSRSALRAEVLFLIHRDGTITGLRFVTRSGVYAFDAEAQGAIEAAAKAGAFGALPTGFTDDVLPVIFSFDPRLIR